ncbi:MAG: hypothetical protein K6F46_00535 [Desulfovibrio sp.]|nr:hypothetical protein [Desulfovibrio sp.]
MSKPEVATPWQPSSIGKPQPEALVVQPVAETKVVPPSSGTSQAKAVAEHNEPVSDRKSPSSTPSLKVDDSGDSIGREIRSALQSYCTMLAEKAEAAEVYGQAKRRDLIRALLHAPVGDQISGLKKWLSREHPEVAQEIGKRLSLARSVPENKDRLRRLEDVFLYLPSDFVRNRLGIEIQEDANDAVAGVAAAKNCTRIEAVKRISSVMPDIMRLGKTSAAKMPRGWDA